MASYALEMLERGTDDSACGSDPSGHVAGSTLLARLLDCADRELLDNAIGLSATRS